MISILRLSSGQDRQRVEAILKQLRLDLNNPILAEQAAGVQVTLDDVINRGDAAIVDSARKFDDPSFTVEQLRVSEEEMKAASLRVPAVQMSAIRRSIAQVREYQSHIMPSQAEVLNRPGVKLAMRYTPLASAGLYFPGGKASYPSSLIMLAVPAQVAGVKQIVVCTPPSKYGRSDLILATAHELQLTNVFRAGGAAAIGAMAYGTATIPAVDKICGPGNTYVQLAKRAVSGMVGVDGFLGPSEIVILADDTARPEFVAADMLAQAEHNPGSCFLLTTSEQLASLVLGQIERQLLTVQRADAIRTALDRDSAIIIDNSMDRLIELADRFASEHVSIQTREEDAVLAKLKNGGGIYVGAYSAVATGDYVAGPSHCLPTNTTARFSSGISVYEFMKRSSVVRYDQQGLKNDAPAIIELATAEHLDAHAASVRVRVTE